LQADSSRERSARRWKLARTAGRLALLALGVGAIYFLVAEAGPGKVWRALLAAGAWLPLIALFEIAIAMVDVGALRLMYGRHARGVPVRVWVRSALMAYGVMVLLPAGRAGGEAIRAASLARYVGGARATAVAALIQGVAGWGNALISLPCYAACAMVAGGLSPVALLVAGNGVVAGLLGTLVLWSARYSSLGGWLGRRIQALATHGARFDASLRDMQAVPVLPIGATLAGRLIQAIQYGFLVLAVGGTFTASSALVAQAIHLIGAGLLPNQTGITEATFRVLGGNLPLADAAAQAIAIALLHRIVQLGLAGASLLVGTLWQPDDATVGHASREVA
jgi:hypothetical protein